MSVLARTLLLLLKSFPASNTFWLAKLAGADERQAALALAGLERDGLATNESGRFGLTALGQKTCRPISGVDLRPAHVTLRAHPSRGRR
jgi:hypothetical protein